MRTTTGQYEPMSTTSTAVTPSIKAAAISGRPCACRGRRALSSAAVETQHLDDCDTDCVCPERRPTRAEPSVIPRMSLALKIPA